MGKRRHRPARGRTSPPRQQARVYQQARRQQVSHTQGWLLWGFTLLVFILAAVLRTSNLTAQSLWADEGNSVRLAERSLDLVIAAARADVHPPGYYLLLWGWVRLFGQGEAAVRALSAVTGMAVVALVYAVGTRAFGRRAGWLAAFCAAVSPFQVQYSQEVRMYVLVALLGTAVTLAFIRWIEWRGRREQLLWSLVYALAAAAGLWTHYSFPVVLAAINVAWLAWWLGRRGAPGQWRSAGWWAGTHLIVLLLYLPWLGTAWAKTVGYGPISEVHSVSFVVAQALKLLSVGETVADDDLTRWLVVGMVGFSVLGIWSAFAPLLDRASRSRARRLLSVRALALCLLVVAPMIVMIGLSVSGRPAFRAKFFLVSSPAFSILVGAGIATLEGSSEPRRSAANRLWLMVGLAIVGVAAARSLRNYYYDPTYARGDYRAIVSFIEGLEREGDAVLLNAPNQWEVFTYYHQQHVPVYPLCRERPPHEEQVVAELAEIASKHDRLFVLYWATEESDPERIVERWLGANAFKASDTWYGDVRLAVYAVSEDLSVAEMEHPLPSVRLGDVIALRGYTVSPAEVRRGDTLLVTLFWEALDVPTGRFKVFLHLAGADGRPVSQYDGEPGDGMKLTTDWRPEEGIFPDRYGVPVPKTLAPGEYRLLVGMYEVSGAPRLPVALDGSPAGDSLTIATLEIR